MKSIRLAGVAAVAAALAVPAAASAHPSVYEITAKVVDSMGTPAPGDTVALKDEDRYLVSNHGYSFLYQETNGVTDHGVVSFSRLPSSYRTQMGFTKTRLFAEGSTGAQVHATCQGVAALWTEANILAWQGSDPFYNYIPFQKDGVGLDDDPADWVDDVLALTGVNLNTVTDLGAACTGLGGTLLEPDFRMPTNLSSGTVTHATEPLLDEIDALEQTAASSDAAAKAATARAMTAETALGGERTTVAVELAGTRLAAARGVAVELTGPPSREVTVEVTIPSSRAKALRLRRNLAGAAVTTLDADGKGTATVEVFKTVRRALKRAGNGVKINVNAFVSDRDGTATATLTR
jgi:hypothetical protein